MHLLLLPCLFAFLFCLYIQSNDDFVFLRKNITLEQIFNIAILGLLVSFFGARALYAISSGNVQFLNPLVFLVFPYFPGFSLLGGVLSGLFFVVMYTLRNKISTARLFDFISCSTLISIAFGFFLFTILKFIAKKHVEMQDVAAVFLYIILSFVFLVYLLPKLRSGELEEGSMGFLFLFLFSLISLVLEILNKTHKILLVLSIEGIISFIVLLISLSFFIKQEKIITKLLLKLKK